MDCCDVVSNQNIKNNLSESKENDLMNLLSCYFCQSLFTRSILFSFFSVILLSNTVAGPREQAKRIHDRLVGIPPTAETLDVMASKIINGDAIGAAYQAMENKIFFNVTLKNHVMPWTNEAHTVFADLNDYVATVIGIVRDDIAFTEILSGDIIYIGSPASVSTPYSHTDNIHYQELERNQVDLSDPTNLFATTQSGLLDTQLSAEDAAGIITTRANAEAFFKAGTNRAAWRDLGLNHLCKDMEELHDITLTSDRIRQDVTRSPGGDSSIFLNSCVGCHNGMDPLAQAFAYLNFDEELNRLVHTPGQVQPKYLINAGTFPKGYVTKDNRWDNYWRTGKNSLLGWRGANSGGFGPKSLGQEVANSRAFSECHVTQVFTKICLREPVSLLDQSEIQRISNVFETNNYSMKRVFAEVATACMGD